MLSGMINICKPTQVYWADYAANYSVTSIIIQHAKQNKTGLELVFHKSSQGVHKCSLILSTPVPLLFFSFVSWLDGVRNKHKMLRAVLAASSEFPP